MRNSFGIFMCLTVVLALWLLIGLATSVPGNAQSSWVAVGNVADNTGHVVAPALRLTLEEERHQVRYVQRLEGVRTPYVGVNQATSITPTVVFSFTVPGNRPRGLTWGAGSLWLVDEDKQVHRLDPHGSVQTSFPITFTASGIGWDGNSLWLSDDTNWRLVQLDETGQISATLKEAYYWPNSGLAWNGNDLYVADYNLAEIHKHDRAGTQTSATPTPTPTPTTTQTSTPTPTSTVTPSPFAGTYLGLVANGAGGTVSVLDVDSGSVIETLTVGSPQGPFSDSPGGIAIMPDQSLALVNYARSGSHRVIVLDLKAAADGVPDNEIIATIPLLQTRPGGSNSIAIVPDGSRAYVVGQGNSDDIAVIDISAINDGIDNNEVSWIDGGYTFFNSIAITPDGKRAYITDAGYSDDVHVLDVDPVSPAYHTFIATISGIGGSDRGIAITPDGNRAYVAESSYDKIYVLDTNPASFTYNTIVHVIDSEPVSSNPVKIAISPDGRRAYVVRSFITQDVAILDIESGSPTYHEIIDTTKVGYSPNGIALTSNGQTALVANEYMDSVSMLDLSNNTEVKRIPVGDEPDGIAIYLAPVPDNHVKVLDEDEVPVSDVSVYHNGAFIGQTDERGVVIPPEFGLEDTFVAMQLLQEQGTQRDGHATDEGTAWAYRTYVTNIEIGADSVPHGHTVSQMGQQRLVLRRSSSLTLFNLVISIEWDATDRYMEEVIRAVQHASNYLYDLTDGQMAFGQVAVYDNGKNWADADIQISTKNIVHPHAYVGGITSEDTSHVIRVGRGWDGSSGNQGAWDQPEGYRTLVHEFGHYALYLYDEYFAYTFDDGNLTGERQAYCTGLENRNPVTDATNASAMDHQYTTTELSARDVPGLWSPLCEATAQWQLTERYLGQGESAWETLSRMYADTVSPPRWQFTTPIDQGSVVTGPTVLPADLLPLPAVKVDNSGASGQPRHLTVYHPYGGGYWGAIVALYKPDRVIGQGFTDSNGQLDVYGAEEGDMLRAASFDGGLAGSIPVSTEMTITLILEPVGGLMTWAEGLTTPVVDKPPHMRVIADPSLDPGQIDLFVFLQNFGPDADPDVTVTEPSSGVNHSPTTWNYSPTTDTYEGQVSFSATQQGMWRIRARAAVGNSLVRLQSTYRLQRVVNDQSHDVYSNDGNLSLHLGPGSLPGNDAYFVVMPPGAVPGPLPDGLVLVGDPYDVTASGAVVTMTKPAVLKLHYDGGLVDQSIAPDRLGIYHWDPNTEEWQAVPGSLDEEQKAMVAAVTTLGTYALLASPACYDVNEDGKVDISDIEDVASRWRMRDADEGWDSKFDLDKSKIVDIVDIMLVAAQWGKRCLP